MQFGDWSTPVYVQNELSETRGGLAANSNRRTAHEPFVARERLTEEPSGRRLRLHGHFFDADLSNVIYTPKVQSYAERRVSSV